MAPVTSENFTIHKNVKLFHVDKIAYHTLKGNGVIT